MILSVQKAMLLLELLAASGETLSLSSIAEETAMNPNTVRSLLSTLVELGYVEQPQHRGRYALGKRVVFLAKGLTSKNALQRVLDTVLWDVHRESGGEAVFGNMVSGLQLIPLSQIEASHLITIQDRNRVYPQIIPSTAQGKIVLANLSESERQSVVGSMTLIKHTEHTITDRDVLLEQLIRVASSNSASSINETDEGAVAVASGIFDSDGRLVATIALQGPQVRIGPETLEKFRLLVLRAAERATDLISKPDNS